MDKSRREKKRSGGWECCALSEALSAAACEARGGERDELAKASLTGDRLWVEVGA